MIYFDQSEAAGLNLDDDEIKLRNIFGTVEIDCKCDFLPGTCSSNMTHFDTQTGSYVESQKYPSLSLPLSPSLPFFAISRLSRSY